MFEKEADHAETVMLVKANLGKPGNYKDGFKDGAEFGYNKAKEELENKNAELKVRLNAINLLTPELEKSSKLKSQRLTYAKTIIKDLLDNSDEYARQRAEDFLKECE